MYPQELQEGVNNIKFYPKIWRYDCLNNIKTRHKLLWEGVDNAIIYPKV